MYEKQRHVRISNMYNHTVWSDATVIQNYNDMHAEEIENK